MTQPTTQSAVSAAHNFADTRARCTNMERPSSADTISLAHLHRNLSVRLPAFVGALRIAHLTSTALQRNGAGGLCLPQLTHKEFDGPYKSCRQEEEDIRVELLRARTHTHTQRCGLWSGHASRGSVDDREDVCKRTRPFVSQIRKKMHANSAMKILSRKLRAPRDTLLPGWSSASSNIEPGAFAHSAQSYQHRHKHPPYARATAVHQPAVGSAGLPEELISPPSPFLSCSSLKNHEILNAFK